MSESTVVDNVDESRVHNVEPSISNADENKDNKVDYGTYSRVLSKLKKLESSFKSLETEASQLRSEKLEAEGKKDDVIKSLRDQLKQKDDDLLKSKKTFGYKVLSSQVTAAARDMGAWDDDLVLKSLDFSEIEIDDDFSVDQKSLRAALDGLRKKKPRLFEDTKKQLADGLPETKPKKNEKTSFDKMSSSELIEAVRSGKIKL